MNPKPDLIQPAIPPLLPATGSAGRWSKRLPRKTGFYWTRNHGGNAVICWYDKRARTTATCKFGSVELTDDYRSTQGTEFWPEQLMPPNTTPANLAETVKSWKFTAKKWRKMSRQRESVCGPSNKEMRAKAETLEGCAREIEIKFDPLGVHRQKKG